MNREWMRQRLEKFKEICEKYDQARGRSDRYTDEQRALDEEMSLQIPTVRKILRLLDPSLPDEVKRPLHIGGTSDSRHAVQMGLGILQDQDDWAANLAPDAPSLVADQFHPHVWSAAAPLWGTGQYRVAVGQAAVALSAHIASKAGSSRTERELMAEVFSPDPPKPKQVRLHLPGDESSRTWRSRQEGLLLVAQGAFAGIRNVAVHTDQEWSEQVALEHLALLSVVARWADETVPVRAT